jgi:hypothetical protein
MAMHFEFRFMCLCALLLGVLGGCADKLKPRKDEVKLDAGEKDAGDRDAVLDGGIPVYTGKFKNSAKKDGSLVTDVDSTDDKGWQQFDLDTGKESMDDSAWDIAFLRFKIKTNGGLSGSGGVYVVQLEGKQFDDIDKAPDMGFAADGPDSVGDAGDADMDPDNVFNSDDADWYDYDDKTHTLTPKDITYVIASTQKKFYKVRIDSYYNAVGTPANWKIHWKQIDPPASGFPPDAGATEDK